MRRSRGVLALLCSALLGVALVGAAHADPGRGPDPRTPGMLAAHAVASLDTMPDLGKRW